MESLRLFYALWPGSDVRAALQRLQATVCGRKTHCDNLHITVAFLGQQTAHRLPELKEILTDLPDCDITLQLDRLDYFHEGRIAWAGMHTVPAPLCTLRSALWRTLEQRGVVFDRKKPFEPHVTLARDAAPPPDLPFETIVWHATQMALLQSVQSADGVVYSMLASRSLKAPV